MDAGAVPALAELLPLASRESCQERVGEEPEPRARRATTTIAFGTVRLCPLLIPREQDAPPPSSLVDATLGALGNLIEVPSMRREFVACHGVARLLCVVYDARGAEADDRHVDQKSKARDGDVGSDDCPSFVNGAIEPDTDERVRSTGYESSEPSRESSPEGDSRSPPRAAAALGWVDRTSDAGASDAGASDAGASDADERLRAQVGWILIAHAVDPEVAHAVADCGGVRLIVEHAAHEKKLYQEEGAWALACLSEDLKNVTVIGAAGAFP